MINLFFSYIVRAIGTCADRCALIMELMAEGNLACLLHSDKELSWSVAINLVEDIAMGLNVLHSNIPVVSIELDNEHNLAQ